MSPEKRAAKLLFMNLVIVGILFAIAARLQLFSYTWWFDDIEHLFSGLVVGYFFFIFRRFFVPLERLIGPLFAVLFFSFVIGIAWEFFEIVAHVGGGGPEGYWVDTIADVTEVIVGSLAAYWFIERKNT